MTRREDIRLITGQGRYTSDYNLPQQLYTVFLRADRASAEILRIDASNALKHPGVAAVYTSADTAEAGWRCKSRFSLCSRPSTCIASVSVWP